MVHRALKTLLVASFALGSVGVVTDTATAEDADWSLSAAAESSAASGSDPQSSWKGLYWQDKEDGDAGGVSISERITKDPESGTWASASFFALGEDLLIQDRHDNGRAAIAKLWVGGNGPAVFYGNGDGDERRVTHLSFAEGQTVHLQVCTSDSPNAECTAKKKYPGIT